MAKVVLEKISKKFGTVDAVKNFDLTVEDKEFAILVGPSGCGKSTALRMVAGLEEPTRDDLYRRPKVKDLPPKDRDIAMVFQEYALYPHMSVYKNMAFGLKLRKFPKEEIDQRVKEASEILGIQNLLDRKPKQLSGGQRQRVAVGRAIVRKPAVFLFDEPLIEPGCEAAGPDAGRTLQAPRSSPDDNHLRHPRPGGSDDHGDEDRRDEGRVDPAGRQSLSTSTTSPSTNL